jgi:hypothetical protein
MNKKVQGVLTFWYVEDMVNVSVRACQEKKSME